MNRSVFIQSQITACNCELEAMKIANHAYLKKGYSPKYSEVDFRGLATRYGLDHNTVVEYLRDE